MLQYQIFDTVIKLIAYKSYLDGVPCAVAFHDETVELEPMDGAVEWP